MRTTPWQQMRKAGSTAGRQGASAPASSAAWPSHSSALRIPVARKTPAAGLTLSSGFSWVRATAHRYRERPKDATVFLTRGGCGLKGGIRPALKLVSRSSSALECGSNFRSTPRILVRFPFPSGFFVGASKSSPRNRKHPARHHFAGRSGGACRPMRPGFQEHGRAGLRNMGDRPYFAVSLTSMSMASSKYSFSGPDPNACTSSMCQQSVAGSPGMLSATKTGSLPAARCSE